MRGRRPIPTAIKRARGNPGKRPLNDLEPQPDLMTPTCPDYLDEDARREWDRITLSLSNLAYHIRNRRVMRLAIFKKDRDHAAFEAIRPVARTIRCQ